MLDAPGFGDEEDVLPSLAAPPPMKSEADQVVSTEEVEPAAAAAVVAAQPLLLDEAAAPSQHETSDADESTEEPLGPRKAKCDAAAAISSQTLVLPRIGDRVEVYWPEESEWFAGTVEDTSSKGSGKLFSV
jgi:hypothetical protein